MSESPWGASAEEDTRFLRLARSSDPPFDTMLLALAAEFHAVDREAALNELDELARPLFGIRDRDPRAAGELMATELAAGLRPGEASVDDLFLDRVLRRGRGHPALLAAVYVEVARRAGLSLSVLSSEHAWFAGLVGDRAAMLVDPAAAGGLRQARLTLRCYCAHELAHVVLCVLTTRFRALGDADSARRAAELRLALPLGEKLLARAKRELRELERE
jgi:Transglutaminase-like superfamily